MPDHNTYSAVVNELLTDLRVTVASKFGIPTLKVSGKAFADYRKFILSLALFWRVQPHGIENECL